MASLRSIRADRHGPHGLPAQHRGARPVGGIARGILGAGAERAGFVVGPHAGAVLVRPAVSARERARQPVRVRGPFA
ncbi:MAG: hypothetical protein IPQ07_38000 [Myxococcales bacterium]|nr:hypothetical protein [Myxococcales bacterium]